SETREPGRGDSAAEHAVWRWARFLMARDEVDMQRLAEQDPVMATAVKTLAELSEDPELARQAREREDSQRLYEMSLRLSRAEGMGEGKVEGIAEGKAEGILQGKAEGIAEGKVLEARRRIRELCAAFQVELTRERRA